MWSHASFADFFERLRFTRPVLPSAFPPSCLLAALAIFWIYELSFLTGYRDVEHFPDPLTPPDIVCRIAFKFLVAATRY